MCWGRTNRKIRRRRVARRQLAIPYVIGPFGLAQRTGSDSCTSEEDDRRLLQDYTGVRATWKRRRKPSRESGVVRRSLAASDLYGHQQSQSRAQVTRGGGSHQPPIQGTAADLVKMAMIRSRNRLRRDKLGARMILQVHDELLLKCPRRNRPHDRSVRAEMESSVNSRFRCGGVA